MSHTSININGETYPTDTTEQIAAARVALAIAGIADAEVSSGDGEDAVLTGRYVFAAEPGEAACAVLGHASVEVEPLDDGLYAVVAPHAGDVCGVTLCAMRPTDGRDGLDPAGTSADDWCDSRLTARYGRSVGVAIGQELIARAHI